MNRRHISNALIACAVICAAMVFFTSCGPASERTAATPVAYASTEYEIVIEMTKDDGRHYMPTVQSRCSIGRGETKIKCTPMKFTSKADADAEAAKIDKDLRERPIVDGVEL